MQAGYLDGGVNCILKTADLILKKYTPRGVQKRKVMGGVFKLADRLCSTQCIGAVPPFVLNWGGWGHWVTGWPFRIGLLGAENKKASRVRRGLHI